MKAEIEDLQLQLFEMRNEVANVGLRDSEKERQLAEQLEAEREKRVQHLQQVGVRRLFQQGLRQPELVRASVVVHELENDLLLRVLLALRSRLRLPLVLRVGS